VLAPTIYTCPLQRYVADDCLSAIRFAGKVSVQLQPEFRIQRVDAKLPEKQSMADQKLRVARHIPKLHPDSPGQRPKPVNRSEHEKNQSPASPAQNLCFHPLDGDNRKSTR